MQGAKSSSDVKAYIEKWGDYFDWGEFQIDARSSKDGRHDLSSVYADALNAYTIDNALQIIREKDPRTFLLQYHNIKPNTKRIFAKPKKTYISVWDYSSFQITEGMQAWIEHNFEVRYAARPEDNNIIQIKCELLRPTSIIIEGPSRTGKTA